MTEPKPNKPLIRRCVKALRSGKYKQGRGRLCTIEPDGSLSHCCLGVIANIIDPDAWREDSRLDFRMAWNGSATCLTEAAEKQLGFSPEIQGQLIRLNDTRHYTFKSIANWLERRFLK